MIPEAIIHEINYDSKLVNTLSPIKPTFLQIQKLKYNPHITCDCSNLVYLIYRNIYDGGNYVGQNGSEFHLQFNNPKDKDKDREKSFLCLFVILLQQSISTSPMTVQIMLDKIFTLNSQKQPQKGESDYILKFNIHYL